MLISNESPEEFSGSVCIESEGTLLLERIAHLKSELHASRAREEAARHALQNLHQELQRAYVRIGRQQEKLKLLVAQVQTQRASPHTAASSAPSLRDTDLALAGHPYCQLLAKFPVPTPTPAQRLPIVYPVGDSRIATLWTSLPKWVGGIISAEDAAFLSAVIEKIRPDQVHEVGVASGSSSALILSTMATYENASPVWLHSYDLVAQCYFDLARNVGDATREVVPGLLDHWNLKVGATALDVPRGNAAGERPLYFIDANHGHPWPTLDLIALLPGLKPGDCVVLHDINLPAKTAGEFPDYGAQWLFDDWLGPRLEPDVALPNIGAIFIPDDWRLILSSIVKSLSRPWTLVAPAEISHLHRCEQRLAEFLAQRNLSA